MPDSNLRPRQQSRGLRKGQLENCEFDLRNAVVESYVPPFARKVACEVDRVVQCERVDHMVHLVGSNVRKGLLFISLLTCFVTLSRASSDDEVQAEYVNYGSGELHAYSDYELIQLEGTSEPVPDHACLYGHSGATLNMILRKQISLITVKAIAIIGITLAGGCVCYIFLSLPGFAFAFAASLIVADVITTRWSTWKYFGPGKAYVRGVTSNGWVLIQHVILCTANKALALLGTAVLARNAFTVEEGRVPRWLTGVRVVLGSIASLIMAAMGGYYAFTSGVPSVYRGSDGLALNEAGCSGPLKWSQLQGYERFSDMVLYIAPAWLLLPWKFISVPVTIGSIICSSITVARRASYYHAMKGAFNLIILVPSLLVIVLKPRRTE